MALVVIIGLVVAVISLLWLASEQSKKIEKYENELKSQSKSTVKVRRVRKNGSQ